MNDSFYVFWRKGALIFLNFLENVFPEKSIFLENHEPNKTLVFFSLKTDYKVMSPIPKQFKNKNKISHSNYPARVNFCEKCKIFPKNCEITVLSKS